MRDEPIRVSSESWTGPLEPAKKHTLNPLQPKEKFSRGRFLLMLVFIAVVSGAQVVRAITEHVVHRRGGDVHQADAPLTFSTHACGAFVLMLAAIALIIFVIVDWWRKRNSPVE
jgi:hypothetical protein